MHNIKYILVNEAGTQNAARTIRNCKLPHIGQCVEIKCGNHSVLINQLVKLRRHRPDAKILGVGELGEHCVHPSEAMNALRRELSDLP